MLKSSPQDGKTIDLEIRKRIEGERNGVIKGDKKFSIYGVATNETVIDPKMGKNDMHQLNR